MDVEKWAEKKIKYRITELIHEASPERDFKGWDWQPLGKVGLPQIWDLGPRGEMRREGTEILEKSQIILIFSMKLSDYLQTVEEVGVRQKLANNKGLE